jgi:hypothetical protein
MGPCGAKLSFVFELIGQAGRLTRTDRSLTNIQSGMLRQLLIKASSSTGLSGVDRYRRARTSRVEGSDRLGRSGFSRGGVLSQNPFKCIVEIAEDAYSVFAQDVAIYLKHAGQSEYEVTAR